MFWRWIIGTWISGITCHGRSFHIPREFFTRNKRFVGIVTVPGDQLNYMLTYPVIYSPSEKMVRMRSLGMYKGLSRLQEQWDRKRRCDVPPRKSWVFPLSIQNYLINSFLLRILSRDITDASRETEAVFACLSDVCWRTLTNVDVCCRGCQQK